jgi:hypothetical protein
VSFFLAINLASLHFASVHIDAVNQINGNGILGLGPSSNSQISRTIGNSTGDPFVDRVFAQNKSTPNFISFTLGREADGNQDITTQFTISEIISGHENISQQQKLPVQLISAPLRSNQHWAIAVDGITGPEGVPVSVSSIIPAKRGANGSSLVAILDSGFTLPQVPSAISDAFYGRVAGAKFNTRLNQWLIPCDQELNVSFTIGGKNYPIHPLDLTRSLSLSKDFGAPTGYCLGTVSSFNSVAFI